MADDAAQTARVLAQLDSASARNASFFVPSTVQLELEWVLRSRYGLDKATVLATFVALLETRELQLQFELASTDPARRTSDCLRGSATRRGARRC